MTRKYIALLFIILMLPSCAKQAQAIPVTATFPSPTETSAPPTATPTEVPTDVSTETPTEIPANTDPTLFGAIPQEDIQAFSLEPIANAIFSKVMDGFTANGNILEYQVVRVTIFPSGNGTLLAEIMFNVRTTDPVWLADGGTQADDNWINDKCSRFDFVTTETEFQLKNKRLCS